MSWSYAENILYNLENFGLDDDDFFEIYLQEKYGKFDENGYPLYSIDDIKQSLHPDLLAAEKLGFLIFKDAYKAAILGKLNKLVDTEKERKAAEAAAAAAASNSGGGGGGSIDSWASGPTTSINTGGGGGWQTDWINSFNYWENTNLYLSAPEDENVKAYQAAQQAATQT
jgi:hypothetical protein